MMKLRLWLALFGIVGACFLGLSFGKERELARARKRAASAEQAARQAQHKAREDWYRRELDRIDAEYEAECRRPLGARVRDAVERAERLYGASA